MERTPARADVETMARRTALAHAVQEDLAAAGLPVDTGTTAFHAAVGSGASVSVSELADENGVFVLWRTHHVLRAAVLTALSEGREHDSPAVHHSGEAQRAMQNAMAEILTATGCTVIKDFDDMSPFVLKVVDRTPPTGPSWQAWLDAQSDALAAARAETIRRHAEKRTP
ncbi:hypothetical protein [Actinophytocola xanthii]|uniref:Uncharacterized protein n=1 Tax=Actinophytocola xanthii TaxID=1912961 RepID=A0A1Q8CKF8_9PSEU|nr:hypothetical protein [Actinophytocola xanthii]OLF14819.1 hypothetical protein BU204_24985 [Actinophytocola xanthii]